jgi:hypothetical protein
MGILGFKRVVFKILLIFSGWHLNFSDQTRIYEDPKMSQDYCANQAVSLINRS